MSIYDSFSLNPPEPREICTCKYCFEPICEGDEQVIFGGSHYHEECFKEAAPEILLEKYGAIRKTAGERYEPED